MILFRYYARSSIVPFLVIIIIAIFNGCGGENTDNVPTQNECIGEGKAILDTVKPAKCCEGLSTILPKTVDTVDIIGICTGKCGDRTCNTETETIYNCPADCKLRFPPTPMEIPTPDDPILDLQAGYNPAHPAMLGREGWFYLADEDILEDLQGSAVFDQVEIYAKNLDARYRWLKEHSVAYLFVIGPNKSSIYPEYIHPSIEKGDTTKIDQLLDYMSENYPDVPILDLRPALLAAKGKHQLYYRTDTHWNILGTDIAQYEIAKYLQTVFPDVDPILTAEEDIYWESINAGDLVKRSVGFDKDLKEYKPVVDLDRLYTTILPRRNVRTDEYPARTIITSNEKVGDLKLLMFRDSFGTDLWPYLSAYYFSESVIIWREPNCASLDKYVEKESPDIVIEQRVERTISNQWRLEDFNCSNETNKTLFQGSSNSRLELSSDNKSEFTVIEATLEPTPNSEMHLIPSGKNPGIEFPPVYLQAGIQYMIKMILEVPDECNIRLYIPRNSDNQSYTENMANFGITKGINEFHIPITTDFTGNKNLKFEFTANTFFDVIDGKHIIKEIIIKEI